MGKLQDVCADALQRFVNFIAESVSWTIGFCAAVASTAITVSAGEVWDDLTTYGEEPLDWRHIAKVVGPPIMLAAGGYIQHRRAVDRALATPPPEPKG